MIRRVRFSLFAGLPRASLFLGRLVGTVTSFTESEYLHTHPLPLSEHTPLLVANRTALGARPFVRLHHSSKQLDRPSKISGRITVEDFGAKKTFPLSLVALAVSVITISSAINVSGVKSTHAIRYWYYRWITLYGCG